MVGQHDVAAGDGDGLLDECATDFEFVADAEREGQRIFVMPGDEEQIRIGQVVMAGADRGQAHGVTVAGIEIGRLAGRRAEDFFENQHIPCREGQGWRIDQRSDR